jgi:hypothetical protein
MSSNSFYKYAFVAISAISAAPIAVEIASSLWLYLRTRSIRNIYEATQLKHTQEYYNQNENIIRFKHPIFDSTAHPHCAFTVVTATGNDQTAVVWIRNSMYEVRKTFFLTLPEIIDAFIYRDLHPLEFMEPIDGIISITSLPYIHPDRMGFM